LFGGVGRVVHLKNAFFGGQAQFFDEQGQVDAESLSGLNAAPGTWMAQTVFRPRELFGPEGRLRFHENTVITIMVAPIPNIGVSRTRAAGVVNRVQAFDCLRVVL
jgi:hypothetical protein